MRTNDVVGSFIQPKENRHTVSSLKYTTIQFETTENINNGGDGEKNTHPRGSGMSATDLLVLEVVVYHRVEQHS